MVNYDEDFESDAIEKCSRALHKLDNNAKIRVVRYLLDKFGLIAQPENQSKEIIHQNIQYQQNNVVLTEQTQTHNLQNQNLLNAKSYIALKDILIKNLTKSEPELLVIICFYNSKYGNDTFTRQSINDAYRDNNIVTEQRRRNLSANLSSLIKKSFVQTITDEDLSITAEGIEYANTILSGNSVTKKRKPAIRKPKSSKVIEIEVKDNE